MLSEHCKNVVWRLCHKVPAASPAVISIAPLGKYVDGRQQHWVIENIGKFQWAMRDTSTIRALKLCLSKPWRLNGVFFKIEIIINYFVSSVRFFWIPMLWVYGHYEKFSLWERAATLVKLILLYVAFFTMVKSRQKEVWSRDYVLPTADH